MPPSRSVLDADWCTVTEYASGTATLATNTVHGAGFCVACNDSRREHIHFSEKHYDSANDARKAAEKWVEKRKSHIKKQFNS
jgi:hypothetical protein